MFVMLNKVKHLGTEQEITIATKITFVSQILRSAQNDKDNDAQDDKVQNNKKVKVNQEKGKRK